MAKNWLARANREMERKGTKGKFSEQAREAGMGTQEFAARVLANPDQYDEKTVRRAHFARVMAKLAKRR